MDFFYTSIISAENLKASLFAENLVIIDCRFSLSNTESGRIEYNKSHIPKSHYAHLDEDLSGEIIPGKTGRHPMPEKEHFVEMVSKWGIDNNTQVIAYDHSHGGIAARLWFLLKWLGHEKVAVLDGGWKAWNGLKYPVTNEVPKNQIKAFLSKNNDQLVVNAEFIKSIAKNNEWLVCDSRTADRYRGENETIDPIAGHIPGAVSVPFIENVDAAGNMLNKKELEQRFKEKLGDHPIEKTVFYCGSGVTACHNLLALNYIGMKEPKIYPGSWSEWITDKSREIEIGD